MIQNDVGETDAHVIVMEIEERQLEITYTEPGLQGDRSSAGTKPATRLNAPTAKPTIQEIQPAGLNPARGPAHLRPASR